MDKDHVNLNKEEVINFEDGLPLPFVKYSRFNRWNWIIEFSDKENGSFKVCECFRKPIENFTKLLIEETKGSLFKRLLRSESKTANKLRSNSLKKIRDRKESFQFELNVCHMCHSTIPSIEWCLPMYGGKFKRSYGWYIERKKYSNELELESHKEYNELAKKIKKYTKEINKIFDRERAKGFISGEAQIKSREIEKKSGKLQRKRERIIENSVRDDFKYKPVGEMWVNETMIYKIVKELFPSSEVIHHYRGKELQGLELDIYIKDKGIGIEYNGKQHYKPIKHFGGEEALKKTQMRDRKKIRLCKKLGIDLHIVKYNEVVSKDLIKTKLGLA